jgi:light-independent protochlorophyllide reductase subunit B
MMGLEEHLIGMFRHDFEFVDGHRSHLGDGAPSVSPVADAVHEGTGELAVASAGSGATVAVAEAPVAVAPAVAPAVSGEPAWTADGEAELHKIPFFVRGKVRRNTETFARDRGLSQITAETLYDAKAHFSR